MRVPKAGGTLFRVDSIVRSSDASHPVSDSSLLLLADILPTGVFAALQALQHPKLSPMISGSSYPFSSFNPVGEEKVIALAPLSQADAVLTIAIVGLGPVGIVSPCLYFSLSVLIFPILPQCAAVSLLDMLADLKKSKGLEYRVVAVDPLESRRDKMQRILSKINVKESTVMVTDILSSKKIVDEWTGSIGCNAVLEVNTPSRCRLGMISNCAIGCREQQCTDTILRAG